MSISGLPVSLQCVHEVLVELKDSVHLFHNRTETSWGLLRRLYDTQLLSDSGFNNA